MAKKERDKDEIWALRKSISRPNFAVMNLLLQKSPRTTRELYSILEKKFTRKTLILTLRELSLDLNVIQPTHIRTEKGYGLGYRLNPKLKEIVKSVQKFSKTIENVGSV
jgi:DNA-binding XRE family transcriptional regulator